jgi:hypothetical protein
MRTEWGGYRYLYEGKYELTSKPGGVDSAPVYGSYKAEILVSWRTDRVVAAHVALNEVPSLKRSW